MADEIDLRAWGDVRVERRLGGGARNDVWSVVANGRRLVARRTRRSAASLDWEIDLLDHLAAHDFTVPIAIADRDGRRHRDGIVLTSLLAGRRPSGNADWAGVAAELERLHELTRNWPQRPGSASTQELLTMERGGDVDLGRMPDPVVARCRAAWARLAGQPTSVVHGDPGAQNILLSNGRIGIIDWDEARVDISALDLVEIPGIGDALVAANPALRRTIDAWEVANGWIVEPAYARRRLSEMD